jgi:hypothetical protein
MCIVVCTDDVESDTRKAHELKDSVKETTIIDLRNLGLSFYYVYFEIQSGEEEHSAEDLIGIYDIIYHSYR